jgi:hypothetical protein
MKGPLQCQTCGLVIDVIPEDAVEISRRLFRFIDGNYHLFRRQRKQPTTRPRRNPDREAPMGTRASEVPR